MGSIVDGRAASIRRRHALSAGKTALPASTDRVRNGLPGGDVHSNGVASVDGVVASVNGMASPNPARPQPANEIRSSREVSRARRAAQSLHGRGTAAPAAGPARVRPAAQTAAAQPIAPPAQEEASERKRVTGWADAVSARVTGEPPQANLRNGTVKVGMARTNAGLIVSGTLVRSTVRVTGDEPGDGIPITGEADQRPQDDVTVRSGAYAGSAQFARSAAPHGASVFGTNLGGAGSAAVRSDERRVTIESTEAGLPITGSAVGRSFRVTGDENGACRRVTGDQYLAPERSQAECGGSLGGSAPASHIGAERRDPVTGAKVVLARTQRGLRISGVDVETMHAVTGGARGAGRTITGSQYAASPERQAAAPASGVTGDVPFHDDAITGTARGAARDITGTPYYAGNRETAVTQDPVVLPVELIDERFSVRSPQRAAHLRAAGNAAGADGARITGAFSAGGGKVTGNLEFSFTPRVDAGDRSGRFRVTGEGRTSGRSVTGEAWSERSKVTGTEGAFAGERNPSVRAGKPQSFSGARRFRELASAEEPKHLVTGMFGYSADNAAKVTLSGGAQG